MAKKKKLVLVDTPAIIHRAFHALPHLSTKQGKPVNAVYGFCMIFLNMLKELKPNLVATTFDYPKPTFRHKMYKEYKGKRVKAPQELYDQIPKIKEIIRALNIPIFEKPGFEADDLIGAIDKKAKDQVDEIIIVTGDLDTLQLVDKKTKVYTMKRGLTDTVIYDQAAVKNRYGLKPEQLLDFKGLRGDPSDNIPGILGIGEKTAADLILKYGSIKGIYKNLDKLTPRLQELLKGKKDKAELAKELVTIKTDLPIKFKLQKCALDDFDRTKVVKIFQELEFKSLLPKLPTPAETAQKSLFARKIEGDYQLIKSSEQLEKLIDQLEKSKGFVVDIETDQLDAVTGKLIGLSFSYKPRQAFYLSFSNDKKAESQLQKLKPVLENPKIPKYGHNLKYDYMILKGYGVELAPIAFDTMIASYLLNSQTRAHKLDQVAFVELGHEMIPIEELIGSGKKQKLLSQAPIEKVAQYSCEDSDISLRLVKRFAPRIKKQKFNQLFYKIEMPLVKVLADMELVGIKLDSLYLAKLSKKVNQKISRLKQKILGLAGCEFNISSTQQLSKILFEKLKISTDGIKRTKTGHSTAASELEKLKGKHKIIDLIREYRELTKLKNTYLDALPRLVNPKTGRLHTSFNQTITATGRLSSSNPNLQNIPARTELGEEIRKSFVVDSGCSLISADYSQIELRIAASLAKDKKMIQAFENDEDIHAATAAEIFGVADTKVTPQMRRVAKTVNFGVLYGMSPYGLAQSLDIKQEKAGLFIKKYFSVYSGVRDYIADIIAETRKSGYVETLSGRRRYLPEINSGMPQVRRAAERMAINMPAQGTAAEIMKLAMIAVADYLEKTKAKDQLLLQVHDELVFEVPKADVKKTAAKIKNIMEEVFELAVSLKVDIKVGKNWKEMEKI